MKIDVDWRRFPTKYLLRHHENLKAITICVNKLNPKQRCGLKLVIHNGGNYAFNANQLDVIWNKYAYGNNSESEISLKIISLLSRACSSVG